MKSRKYLRKIHLDQFKLSVYLTINSHLNQYYQLFQRALAKDLQVQNMREGFWTYPENVTVVGFGRTTNRKISEADLAKVTN